MGRCLKHEKTRALIGRPSSKSGRGATTEAENKNVDTADIELINRCRKREATRGTEAGLSMRQVYTQVSRAVVESLRFSQIR